MNPENSQLATDRSKKQILIWIAGGLSVVTFSFLATIMLLSYAYRSQGAQNEASGTGSTNNSQQKSTSNRAITAASYKEFSAVCAGYTITNAAKPSTRPRSIVATFTQSQRVPDAWTYEATSHEQSYVSGDDYKKIDTVACLNEIRDTRVFAKMCEYKIDEQPISIRYSSVRYKLSYYDATTGFRIADGGIVETPIGTCPDVATHDQQGLSMYAAPDTSTIESYLKAYLSRR